MSAPPVNVAGVPLVSEAGAIDVAVATTVAGALDDPGGGGAGADVAAGILDPVGRVMVTPPEAQKLWANCKVAVAQRGGRLAWTVLLGRWNSKIAERTGLISGITSRADTCLDPREECSVFTDASSVCHGTACTANGVQSAANLVLLDKVDVAEV